MMKNPQAKHIDPENTEALDNNIQKATYLQKYLKTAISHLRIPTINKKGSKTNIPK